MLTTFNTIFGRYRFNQFPFGISTICTGWVSKKSQWSMWGIAGHSSHQRWHHDEDHDTNMWYMLERTRERGIKFNEDKSIICVPEVRYFGHTGRNSAWPQKSQMHQRNGSPKQLNWAGNHTLHDQLPLQVCLQTFRGNSCPETADKREQWVCLGFKSWQWW